MSSVYTYNLVETCSIHNIGLLWVREKKALLHSVTQTTFTMLHTIILHHNRMRSVSQIGLLNQNATPQTTSTLQQSNSNVMELPVVDNTVLYSMCEESVQEKN